MKPTCLLLCLFQLCLLQLFLLAPSIQAQIDPTPIQVEPLDDDIESPAKADPLANLERQAERRFEEDDLEGAVQIYRQIADSQSNLDEKMRLMVTVAWIETMQGRQSQAKNTLTEALAQSPNYPFQADLYDNEFRTLFYDAQQAALDRRNTAAEDDIREGVERMRAKDYATARKSLERALSVLPDHPQGLYNLALVNLLDQKSDDALDGFQKFLALQAARPDSIKPGLHARALNNLGYLYLQKQQPQEALDVLTKAVEVDPQNRSSWTNLGAAQRQSGQKQLAAEAFRRAYQLAPESPEAIYNLALAYIDAASWTEAVALLVEATQKITDDPRLWLSLGEAQIGMGNLAGAIQSLESAVQNDPDNGQGIASSASLKLAVGHYGLQEYSRVLVHAGQALRWQSSLTDAWVYQGLAQQKLNDSNAARASFEEAKRLDPTRADVHNNLGDVYFGLGLLTEAAAEFERALVLDPNLSSAKDNLEAIRQVQRGERTAPGRSPRTARSTPTPPVTPPPRPQQRIGWRFADIDYSAIGLKGAMIESVAANTPAARAGLQPKDLILKVDGEDVTTTEALEQRVRQQGEVVLNLLRANEPTTVRLKLE